MKVYQPYVETDRVKQKMDAKAKFVYVTSGIIGIICLIAFVAGIIMLIVGALMDPINTRVAVGGVLLAVGSFILIIIVWKIANKNTGVASRTLDSYARKLVKFADKKPALMDYFGIVSDNYVHPLPDVMLSRKLVALLPNDFDKSTLKAYKYDKIKYNYFAAKRDLFLMRFPTVPGKKEDFATGREILVQYFEPSALKKYMMRALVNMQNHLDIPFSMKTEEILNNFIVVSQEKDRKIYYTLDEKIDIDFIEFELMKICSALGINYGDMGLGDYSAGRTGAFAIGSVGFVATVFAITALSNIGSGVKEEMFRQASIYYAFNNIVEHFNKTFGLVF